MLNDKSFSWPDRIFDIFSFLSNLYFYAFSSPSISYKILIKYFYADGSISADYSHLAKLEIYELVFLIKSVLFVFVFAYQNVTFMLMVLLTSGQVGTSSRARSVCRNLSWIPRPQRKIVVNIFSSNL